MRLACCTFLAILHAAASGADYQGKVGKWEANFSIEFHSDGTVSGTYSYPRRPGVIYRLNGENREEGKLNLDEFTNGELTARCQLTKTVTEARIVWQGLMFNTDGRGPFEMSFSRLRDDPRDSRDAELPPLATNEVPDHWPFSPTPLNAHVFGKVYFGTFGGEPAWGALVFEGEKAELQFSGANTGWKKRVLNGTNPESGTLMLSERDGSSWKFDKALDPDRIIWRATDPQSGESLSLSRRRENDWLNDDYRVAPESCRWMYTSDPDQGVFYQAKIGRFELVANEVVVKTIEKTEGKAGAVVFSRAGHEDQRFRFQPPRPLNRIPVVEGMTVNAKVDPQGRIRMTYANLGPHAYRVDSQGLWELLMSPAEKGFVGREAPKIVVRPDFFDIGSPSPFIGWWIDEDIIEWNEEAAGPGALELETISLDSITPQNEDSRATQPQALEPQPVMEWRPIPEWNWFYDEHLDPDGPRRTVPLQMRIWSAG